MILCLEVRGFEKVCKNYFLEEVEFISLDPKIKRLLKL